MELIEILPLIAQLDSEGLVSGLRGFFLPIVVLVIGLGAVVFLVQQRASGLVGFLLVGVIVVALLTTPGVIESTGQWLGQMLS
ncbi:hypothetical protein [Nitriliruptor alkaliphilus]|uniref:hypothetical protein n=1 Tax=Nitriliruptor alkaliphilus TaxID=427918 RepID=UPI0006984971|nr:hypothetical protein [Nitriliruptor alkaliphilus]